MTMRLTTTTALLPLLALAAVPARAAGPKTVTFVQSLTGNPFYDTVACGAADEAKKLGVTFNAQGPAQYQPQLQMRVLDAVVAAHPDGILFAATDPVALTPTLLQAKAAGIKIISIDGDLKDMTVALANIQSDNTVGGRTAAQELAKLINDKGTVIALMNTPAASVSHQRLDGFEEEIRKHKDINYLGVQYSNNQTAKAASIVTSTYAAHPDLNGVVTLTTNNTEGAATGVREAGMVGKIKIVGFDTSDPIVEDLRKNIVQADIVQYPFQVGILGVRMMVDALDGKPVEREVHTPFVVATPANVDTAEVKKYIYKTKCD